MSAQLHNTELSRALDPKFKSQSQNTRKQEASVAGSRNSETCRSASCFMRSLMQTFSNHQHFPCGIPLFEKLFPCASVGFPTSSMASIVPGLDCSFRAEEKKLIVPQFRKSVTCFPATEPQRSIVTMADGLSYMEKTLRRRNGERFTVQICNFYQS